MNHSRLLVFGLMLFCIIAFGAGSAGAFPAAGPYYIPPSWDQTLPAANRFIVLTNMSKDAVLDRETGLVWQQSPGTKTFTWEFAQAVCNSAETGGRLGWRLPTLQELLSLIDPTESPLALPTGHPFSNVQFGDLQSDLYWTATSFAVDSTQAWMVWFGNVSAKPGLGGFAVKAASLHYVWCVRGGQGVDPQ